MDFHQPEFPGGFDAILQCDVGVFGDEFFRKLLAALNPGGRLFLVEHFSPAENRAPEASLEWTFLQSLIDPNYTIPTIPQVRAQLAQAGFELLPGEILLADQRILLQSQK